MWPTPWQPRAVRTDHSLRAVFDTNIVVSALVFGGRLSWLRTAWAARSVVPVICRGTIFELVRVLAYPKFRLTLMIPMPCWRNTCRFVRRLSFHLSGQSYRRHAVTVTMSCSSRC
jgi:hypothetical protein